MQMKKMPVIFVALTICASFLGGCGNGKTEYAVKINNNEVSRAEFMIYLNDARENFEAIGGTDIWETDFDGKTAEEVAKESALSTISAIKLSKEMAAGLGVAEIDETIKEQAKKSAKEKYEALTESQKKAMGATEADFLNVILDGYIYSAVYYEIVKDYVVSEADFEQYFNDSKADFENQLVMYNLKAMIDHDRAKCDAALEKFNQGKTMEELSTEYNFTDLQAYRGELEDSFGIEFDLKKGEISQVVSSPAGFCLIYADSLIPSDAVAVKESARKQYENNMKNQLFTQESEKWKEKLKIEKNDEVWKSIKIIK